MHKKVKKSRFRLFYDEIVNLLKWHCWIWDSKCRIYDNWEDVLIRLIARL